MITHDRSACRPAQCLIRRKRSSSTAGDQLPVLDQGRQRVAVERVDPKDAHAFIACAHLSTNFIMPGTAHPYSYSKVDRRHREACVPRKPKDAWLFYDFVHYVTEGTVKGGEIAAAHLELHLHKHLHTRLRQRFAAESLDVLLNRPIQRRGADRVSHVGQDPLARPELTQGS